MAVAYMWNPKMDGLMKGNADKIGHELETLTDVTPENVLELAKDPGTELHKCFTWDDHEAAKKWRLNEARKVIQLIMVAPQKKTEQPTRVFQISSTRNVYQPTKFFVENKDEYQKLLARAKSEALSFSARFKSLAEMEPIIKAIEETV